MTPQHREHGARDVDRRLLAFIDRALQDVARLDRESRLARDGGDLDLAGLLERAAADRRGEGDRGMLLLRERLGDPRAGQASGSPWWGMPPP